MLALSGAGSAPKQDIEQLKRQCYQIVKNYNTAKNEEQEAFTAVLDRFFEDLENNNAPKNLYGLIQIIEQYTDSVPQNKGEDSKEWAAITLRKVDDVFTKIIQQCEKEQLLTNKRNECTKLKEEIRGLIKEIGCEFPVEPMTMMHIHTELNFDVSNSDNDKIDTCIVSLKHCLNILNKLISTNNHFKFLSEDITTRSQQILEQINSTPVFPIDSKNEFVEKTEKLIRLIGDMKAAYNSGKLTEYDSINKELKRLIPSWTIDCKVIELLCSPTPPINFDVPIPALNKDKTIILETAVGDGKLT